MCCLYDGLCRCVSVSVLWSCHVTIASGDATSLLRSNTVHVIQSHLTVLVCMCVCLLCPLHITGMGNQWVQLFYVYLQQGWMLHVTFGNVVMVLCISLSQASSILLLLGFWAASLPKVMSSVDIEGRFLTHKLPACTVSLLYRSTFWKPALIYPCVSQTRTWICCL